MRTKLWMMAAVAASALAAPALAVQYRFDVFDPTATQSGQPLDNNSYTFYFDSAPTPDASDSFSFTLAGSAYYRVTFSGGAFSDYRADGAFTFYTDPGDLGFGGLDTPLNSYFGPQLFTGTTAAPTFKTGTFALDQGSSITISGGSPSPTPEPASWAMMIAGFGLVGGTMRVRRRSVSFG